MGQMLDIRYSRFLPYNTTAWSIVVKSVDDYHVDKSQHQKTISLLLFTFKFFNPPSSRLAAFAMQFMFNERGLTHLAPSETNSVSTSKHLIASVTRLTPPTGNSHEHYVRSSSQTPQTISRSMNANNINPVHLDAELRFRVVQTTSATSLPPTMGKPCYSHDQTKGGRRGG